MNNSVFVFRLETQRDEALQNFLEAQDTLEDFQKKTKERLKQVCYVYCLQ